MRFTLPILHQEIVDGRLVQTKSKIDVLLDTSIYSEERWEKFFPEKASRGETLFGYVEKIQNSGVSDRVQVASMLKAIFCFIESNELSTFKDFAQMFALNNAEYITELIKSLKEAFFLVLGSSATKN